MALVKGVNCGFVPVAPVADPVDSNWTFDTRAIAFKDVSPLLAARVHILGAWVDNATPNAVLEFGIYTHDVIGNKPDVLLGMVTIAKGVTAGWKSQICNIAIAPSTIYWIASQLDNTTPDTICNVGTRVGEKYDYKIGQTQLTNPWGVSTGTFARFFGVYAVWDEGGEPPPSEALYMDLSTPAWTIKHSLGLFTKL